ncbi:hypothetical protein, conserved, partial [Babesia bigemina]
MLLKKPCRTLTPRLSSLGDSVKKAVENAIIAQINSNEELIKLYSSLVTNLSVSVNPAGQTDDTAVIGPLQVEVSKKIAEITDQITQLEQQNKLNNHSLPSPSPSAELAKLHSKLEALKEVEKLCGFLTNSNKQQNNPTNNILTHLCDGLETFLGFNSETKGYDGSGIVYSDLDRLCDGVMGFLSGVLSNIHKHLGQHKETINEAITSLNTNKHLGKKGFNVAIGKVVAGVRGYNEKVKRSNDDVKGKIEDLYNYVKTENGGKLRSEIQNMQDPENPLYFESAVFNAENLVKQAVAKSTHFATELNRATKDINDFNLDCKTNVNHALKNVKHETERLEQSAAKEGRELKATEDVIKTTLDIAKQKINESIKVDVKKLIEKVKTALQSILTQMRRISKEMQRCIAELQEWISKVEKFLGEDIEKHVKKIVKEINKDDSYELPNQIKIAVQNTKTAVVQLNGAGEEGRKQVEDNVKAALEQVKVMNDKLKQDLYAVKQAIKGAITRLGETLKKNVNQDLGALKEKITKKFNPIATDATEFFKHFSSTKGALDRAMRAVATDLANIKDLSRIGRITDVLGFVPLLTEIGKNGQNPFSSV